MSADTATAPPQLRPLALGEIIDVSIKLMRRNWRTLALLVLVVSVPVAIVSLLITTSTTTYDATLDTRTGDGAAYVAGALVNLLLQVVLYLLTTVSCFLAIADAYMGRRPDWRSSLRFAARRAPAALAMTILYFFGIFAGAIFILIGLVFVAVRWSVAMPALLLERRGPMSALGRSWSLVSGFWWKCFGTLLVVTLLVFLLSIAVGAVAGGLLAAATSANSLLALLVTQALDVAVQVFTLPLSAAVTVVLYVDLRVRKEGFDLALMADHIAHPEQPPGSFSAAPGAAPPAVPDPGDERVSYGPPSESPPEPPRHPAFGE
jgi:hypothetical protein